MPGILATDTRDEEVSEGFVLIWVVHCERQRNARQYLLNVAT
jgi:hypothetical protein